MSPRSTLVLGVVCMLTDQLGARLLDAIGLTQEILAPSGARLLLLVPVSCAFYGARLVTYFVLPGLVLLAGARALSLTLKASRSCRRHHVSPASRGATRPN
jgi:hypothetical protein